MNSPVLTEGRCQFVSYLNEASRSFLARPHRDSCFFPRKPSDQVDEIRYENAFS
jgi:hypothetical protein